MVLLCQFKRCRIAPPAGNAGLLCKQGNLWLRAAPGRAMTLHTHPDKGRLPTHSSLRGLVDLWVFALDAKGRLPELEALLAPEERARGQRFAYADDRARFTIGRGLLRTILASYLPMPAASLRIVNGRHGKPHLAGDGQSLHFNLTHSDGWAAVAVSRAVDVGIDIERLRPIEAGFAGRYFSTIERQSLAQLPDYEQPEGLVRCWTRKEAVLKAQGVGLLGDLKSFDVTIGSEVEQSVSGLAGPWSLMSFTPAPGFVGALAAMAARIDVSRRDLGSIWPAP